MGDQPPRDLVEGAREAYLAANGDHPMTPQDDAYVRAHFVPADETSLRLTADGTAPLPSYVLSDGTPMVPADHLALVARAGAPQRVRDWFLRHWLEAVEGPDLDAGERAWRTYLAGRCVDLVEVTPIAMRIRDARTRQAAEALAVLADDPGDVTARSSLSEAVDGGYGVRGLDSLLLPGCDHDRLRFGEPLPRRQWVDDVRATWFSPVPAPLPVRTERLVLRAPVPEDAAEVAPAYADPDFVRHLLSPPLSLPEVEAMLVRRSTPDSPHRALAITIEHDGRVVGDMILVLQGTGLVTAEIGWTVVPWAAGQGFATEAAAAAIDLAFEHYGLHRVFANLDADNAASAALAERLGMRPEVHRREDFWSKGRWTSSLEFSILRPEWEARRG